MKEYLSRFGVTGDRLLWGVAAILVVIVLGGILFSSPETPVPFGASGDDLSVTSETMEGRVIRVLSEEAFGAAEDAQYVQQIEVEITSGSMRGQRVVTEHGGTTVATESSRVKPGMRVIVEHAAGPVGDRYYWHCSV
jgi:hypothetical protein